MRVSRRAVLPENFTSAVTESGSLPLSIAALPRSVLRNLCKHFVRVILHHVHSKVDLRFEPPSAEGTRLRRISSVRRWLGHRLSSRRRAVRDSERAHPGVRISTDFWLTIDERDVARVQSAAWSTVGLEVRTGPVLSLFG